MRNAAGDAEPAGTPTHEEPSEETGPASLAPAGKVVLQNAAEFIIGTIQRSQQLIIH